MKEGRKSNLFQLAPTKQIEKLLDEAKYDLKNSGDRGCRANIWELKQSRV